MPEEKEYINFGHNTSNEDKQNNTFEQKRREIRKSNEIVCCC